MRVGVWILHAALAEGGTFAVHLQASSLARSLTDIAPKTDVAAAIDKLAAAEGWSSKKVSDRWRLTRDDAVTSLVTAGGASVARLVPELLHAFEEAERVLVAFTLAVSGASPAADTRASRTAQAPQAPRAAVSERAERVPHRVAGLYTRAQIVAAIEAEGYHLTRVAERLGWPRRTLYRRMQSLGIPLQREAVEQASTLPATGKDNA